MRSETKKKTILAATQELLVEQGGPQLTMRKVAERAGISLGNLQYHFSKREVLLQALLGEFLSEYETSMAQLAARPSGNLQRDLEKLFITVFSHPDIEACGFVFKELWAEAQHDNEMKLAMTAYYERLNSFYVLLLSELSGVSPHSPGMKQAVAMVVPLMEGYCITGNVSHYSDKYLAKSWARIIGAVLVGD